MMPLPKAFRSHCDGSTPCLSSNSKVMSPALPSCAKVERSEAVEGAKQTIVEPTRAVSALNDPTAARRTYANLSARTKAQDAYFAVVAGRRALVHRFASPCP